MRTVIFHVGGHQASRNITNNISTQPKQSHLQIRPTKASVLTRSNYSIRQTFNSYFTYMYFLFYTYITKNIDIRFQNDNSMKKGRTRQKQSIVTIEDLWVVCQNLRGLLLFSCYLLKEIFLYTFWLISLQLM